MAFPASQWMQQPYFKSKQCTDDFVKAMGGDKYLKQIEKNCVKLIEWANKQPK